VVYTEKSIVLKAHLFRSPGERVRRHVVSQVRYKGALNYWKGVFRDGHSTVLSVSHKGI